MHVAGFRSVDCIRHIFLRTFVNSLGNIIQTSLKSLPWHSTPAEFCRCFIFLTVFYHTFSPLCKQSRQYMYNAIIRGPEWLQKLFKITNVHVFFIWFSTSFFIVGWISTGDAYIWNTNPGKCEQSIKSDTFPDTIQSGLCTIRTFAGQKGKPGSKFKEFLFNLEWC